MTDDAGSQDRSRAAPVIEDLGRQPYAAVHAQMHEIAQSIRRGECTGKVLLVEHESVWTAGRATPPAEMRDDFVRVERGGRVTWHGPGQLVVYPIVRLPRPDAGAWLRALERFGIAICEAFGLAAEASTDGTGVFVAGRKVASIGVALHAWVNIHGIAINVDVDLSAFHAIRPCGLDPALMSDLSRCICRRITLDEAKAVARTAIPQLVAG